MARGTRTVLSRHDINRTYHGAVAKLADPAIPLRPTARRVLPALRDGGPQRIDQLAAQLTATSRRPIRTATVAVALHELVAAALVAADVDDQEELAGRWTALPVARDPLLDAVDLHGAHDFRHTFSTWLEDAGIPARGIDELMGHRPPAMPVSSAAAPRAPTTGTPRPRWPPVSPQRSSSASLWC